MRGHPGKFQKVPCYFFVIPFVEEMGGTWVVNLKNFEKTSYVPLKDYLHPLPAVGKNTFCYLKTSMEPYVGL